VLLQPDAVSKEYEDPVTVMVGVMLAPKVTEPVPEYAPKNVDEMLVLHEESPMRLFEITVYVRPVSPGRVLPNPVVDGVVKMLLVAPL